MTEHPDAARPAAKSQERATPVPGPEQEAAPGAAPEEARREVESLAAERLTFFSDAVVAIALTLLALELPTPEGISASALWRAFGDHFDAYLAFCLSFVVIAAHWSAHHDLFRWLQRSDDRLRWLNLWWLFTVVITPFASRVISESQEPGPGETDTTEPLRFAIYAGVQVATVLVFVLVARHMSHARLLRPTTPSDEIATTYRAGWMFAAAFGLSIPLFFLTPYAWVLWIVIPFGTRIYRRMRHRRQGADR